MPTQVQPEKPETRLHPAGHPAGTGDAIPRSNLDWVLARTTTPRSGWHAPTTCNGPQLMLSATLPGYVQTTGRHCRGIRPNAWPMQLDQSKCPVGLPDGCPQQPGDIHGRVNRSCRANTCAPPPWLSWTSTASASHPLPAGGRGPPERSPPAGEGGAGPHHGLETSRGILSVQGPIMLDSSKRQRSWTK